MILYLVSLKPHLDFFLFLLISVFLQTHSILTGISGKLLSVHEFQFCLPVKHGNSVKIQLGK